MRTTVPDVSGCKRSMREGSGRSKKHPKRDKSPPLHFDAPITSERLSGFFEKCKRPSSASGSNATSSDPTPTEDLDPEAMFQDTYIGTQVDGSDDEGMAPLTDLIDEAVAKDHECDDADCKFRRADSQETLQLGSVWANSESSEEEGVTSASCQGKMADVAALPPLEEIFGHDTSPEGADSASLSDQETEQRANTKVSCS